MNVNANGTTDNDQHGETCHTEGHVPWCQGAAGGEHELDSRYSPDPSWTEGADGYVVAPLDWRGTLNV